MPETIFVQEHEPCIASQKLGEDAVMQVDVEVSAVPEEEVPLCIK